MPDLASAEVYPSRPVHMIVEFPAGLAPDVLARLISESLSHQFGQNFVVENKPGAGGNVGAEYVIRAAPDGYTLLVMVSANAVHIGKLSALGVTSMKRMEALPDVPAISESLPGYEGSGWAGVGGPIGTPAEIIGALNKNINAIIADPAMKARFVALGAEPETMTPSQFGALIANAADKWAKVISFASIKLD